MTAEWRPDPFGRAHYRYHDGSSWTHHVATNGQPSVEPSEYPLALAYPTPPMPTFAPPRGGGRLVAAGVLAIISGGITFVGALGMTIIAATASHFGCDDPSIPEQSCSDLFSDVSDVFYVMAAIVALLSALFIVAGIGACRRRYWGQVTLIVIGVAAVLIQLVAMSQDYSGPQIVPIVWFGVITGLAIANSRADETPGS